MLVMTAVEKFTIVVGGSQERVLEMSSQKQKKSTAHN